MSRTLQETDIPTPMQQGEELEFDQFIEGLTPEKMQAFVSDMLALRKGRQDGNPQRHERSEERRGGKTWRERLGRRE